MEPAPGALAPRTPDLMLQALIEQKADPEALSKMMDLVERWQANEAKRRYAEALSGFQADCPMIFKGRDVSKRDGGKMYAFASYDDIKAVTRPLEKKYGLTVDFTIDQVEGPQMGQLKGTCRVRVGSHFEDKTLTVPVPKGMNTNATQDYGAAVTYLKRYLYCAALDIVVTGEDRDAQGLGQAGLSPQQIEAVNSLIDQIEKRKIPYKHDVFLRIWSAETVGDIPAREFADAVTKLTRKLEGGGK